jgi:uncharacterized protein YbjT (DUF2867 family)
MKRILITGATGNIGKEVIHYITKIEKQSSIVAAVRNIEKAKSHFSDYPELYYRQFDFKNPNSYGCPFENIDILFLLRPPHISKVEKYFNPLLKSAKKSNIRKIVFLSVQGAEKNKFIPHNKIEGLIKSYNFEYIFVRPSYFMQNITTALLPEIQNSRTITLPSGKAKFNWIDAKNIGEVTAQLINSFDQYKNNTFEITGRENKSFYEVAILMSKVTGLKIGYKSVNPVKFYFRKRKEGVKSGLALVMTILHFLPRIQKEPDISDNFKRLTGKEPTSLEKFIERENKIITGSSNQ